MVDWVRVKRYGKYLVPVAVGLGGLLVHRSNRPRTYQLQHAPGPIIRQSRLGYTNYLP